MAFDMESIAIQDVLDAFADAVIRSNTRDACEVLVDRAREMQGCGNPEKEGIDPQLLLAIRHSKDLKLIEVRDETATAVFPDFKRNFNKKRETAEPQLVRLRKVWGVWRISDFGYAEP